MEKNTTQINCLRSKLECERLLGMSSSWNSDNPFFSCTLMLGLAPEDQIDLPAGVAEFSPLMLTGVNKNFAPNLSVQFDFLNPNKVLGAVVHAGIVEQDILLDSSPAVSWSDQGRIDESSRWMLKLIIGEDNLRNLFKFPDGNFIWFKQTLAIERIGRIARMQTSLADRRIPLDGLWALEAASLLDEAINLDSPSPHPSATKAVDDLIEKALPAVRLMNESWLSWLEEPLVERLVPLFKLLQDKKHENIGGLAIKILSEHSK